MKQNAIVLLSGGLDSATALAIAKAQGFTPYALSFRYGQRHAHELACAKQVARHQGVAQHLMIDVDLSVFGGSALTSAEIAVPKGRSASDISAAGEIPVTYVPARNTIFLSYALAWAEVLPALDIFIGVNALDYSGYPDCRPAYIEAFTKMANLATKAGVSGQPMRIHTPLIDLKKSAIIEKGLKLGVDYALTSTCYAPTLAGQACGQCDACLLRLKGFKQLKLTDPVKYV